MTNQPYFDFIIIGSGMGGSTMAYALKDTGASILILERGDFLPPEAQNWDARAVSRYRADETWFDASGQPFQPRIYYNVGGNTKVYGAAMLRYRAEDFTGLAHEEGHTTPWPITYTDLAPYYDRAEHLLGVRGQAGEDPTEPPRGQFPYPPMPHEPVIEALADSLRQQGLQPFHLPVAVDLGPNGSCIRCHTCDGFPCQVLAKGEAETRLLRPALASPTVSLWTKAQVLRLIPSPAGQRVEAVEVVYQGETCQVRAGRVILSAGAVNSPALLLKSKNAQFPHGLANSSGLVGRNYMAHNNTVLMAVAPWRKNSTRFQKTLAVTDFYLSGSRSGHPLGCFQMRGKVLPEMLQKKESWLLRTFSRFWAERSVDVWVMSEDLPDPNNRVWVDEREQIHLTWQPNNVEPHRQLVEKAKAILRRAGFPLIFSERRGIETISHQCGTLRFGLDPQSAVLDPWCRSFDLPNLFVVDTSFYPSSAAVNPALTLVAQALRVADYLKNLDRTRINPDTTDKHG
jgi:choline dehydrogenase-like flavoprotein